MSRQEHVEGGKEDHEERGAFLTCARSASAADSVAERRKCPCAPARQHERPDRSGNRAWEVRRQVETSNRRIRRRRRPLMPRMRRSRRNRSLRAAAARQTRPWHTKPEARAGRSDGSHRTRCGASRLEQRVILRIEVQQPARKRSPSPRTNGSVPSARAPSQMHFRCILLVDRNGRPLKLVHDVRPHALHRRIDDEFVGGAAARGGRATGQSPAPSQRCRAAHGCVSQQQCYMSGGPDLAYRQTTDAVAQK